jgi:hypothetical protein
VAVLVFVACRPKGELVGFLDLQAAPNGLHFEGAEGDTLRLRPDFQVENGPTNASLGLTLEENREGGAKQQTTCAAKSGVVANCQFVLPRKGPYILEGGIVWEGRATVREAKLEVRRLTRDTKER